MRGGLLAKLMCDEVAVRSARIICQDIIVDSDLEAGIDPVGAVLRLVNALGLSVDLTAGEEQILGRW